MRALVEIMMCARVSKEAPLKFFERSEQKPNFACTATFLGTIHDPYQKVLQRAPGPVSLKSSQLGRTGGRF